MSISVKFEIPKDLFVKDIDKFEDNVIHNAARITLDYTNSKKRFPYLTGELNKASMSQGVTKEGKNTYWLGVDETVDYAKYVWDMPEGTNWTNKATYHQWYLTEFKNEKELIMNVAVDNAKKGIRIEG